MNIAFRCLTAHDPSRSVARGEASCVGYKVFFNESLNRINRTHTLMFKSEGRVRELFRKYGKTALATHLTVYGVTFAGIAATYVSKV